MRVIKVKREVKSFRDKKKKEVLRRSNGLLEISGLEEREEER
jgi:hypothetical protein